MTNGTLCQKKNEVNIHSILVDRKEDFHLNSSDWMIFGYASYDFYGVFKKVLSWGVVKLTNFHHKMNL
jgi:hypothetical protein